MTTRAEQRAATPERHACYVMAGAGSLLFAVAPECRRLTPEAAEAHAEFVARRLVP